MKKFLNKIGRTVRFVLRVSLGLGIILIIVFGITYVSLSGKFLKAAEVQPKQEDTFDAFFERKVADEKARAGFKQEIDAYADKKARDNVMHAIITRMEQKVN